MRGSEFYRRYMDRFTAIARAPEPCPDWRGKVEGTVKQLHLETMPMTRAPFRLLQDDMSAELAAKASSQPPGRARDAFTLAADLIRTL